MLKLIDDGTLDTVLRCDDCGGEQRYNYQTSDFEGTYDEFLDMILEDASDLHECPGSNEEPDDDACQRCGNPDCAGCYDPDWTAEEAS